MPCFSAGAKGQSGGEADKPPRDSETKDARYRLAFLPWRAKIRFMQLGADQDIPKPGASAQALPSIMQVFRKRALKKLFLGLLGCLFVAGLFLGLAFAGYTPHNPFVFIPAAIPFVYFCIGTIELLTGRPYRQLADAWMSLKGWQRGIIGTLIVVGAGFLLVIVITAVVMHFT